MTSQAAGQQPAPRRGLLVIYIALLTKLSRELLGADADRNLIDSADQGKQRGSYGHHRRAMP